MLSRSKPLARKTPLKRTGRLKHNKPLRSRRRRPTVAEGSKYLAACRGEPCYLRVLGVCPLNPIDETIVPCHENTLEAGKGMGIKANNERTLPGCFWCHSWLDQGRAPFEEKQAVFIAAFAVWLPARARKMGELVDG